MPNVGTGAGSLLGGSVPLYEPSELRPASTGYNALTLTAPLAVPDAPFLVCRSLVAPGSTGAAQNIFGISSVGTLMTYRQQTAALSTATTAAAPGTTQSGTFFTHGGWSSGAAITLPTPANGLIYLFFENLPETSAATRFTCGTTGVMYAGATTGADAAVFGSTAAGLNSLVICVSDGTNWYLAGIPNGTTASGASSAVASGWLQASR